ncbi:Transcription elongation factor 1 domain [Trypanosoma vivax]|nr:RNA editing complex protein MP90 [Trypanosoma vivax]KAH8611365.1 Transcription elongation factor 1 domain [Trypanosoma vivax]
MIGRGKSSTQPTDGAASATPHLSRNSRTFVQKRLQRNAKKDSHGVGHDFAQNMSSKFQLRSLHCLTKFNCPVCHVQGSVKVDLNTRERQAIVTCRYCLSVQPKPQELPYPYVTSFVPRLENRADVFFKFNELYRNLEMQAVATLDNREIADDHSNVLHDACENGVLSLSSVLIPSDAVGKRQPPNGDVEEEGESGSVHAEAEDDNTTDKDINGDNVENVQDFFGSSDDD